MKKDRIKDISDDQRRVRPRSTRCRIVIDLKRDADPNVVINQLYQYTPCQITVSMINIALVNRQPRTMGLKELIQHFIEHRKEVITRRTRFLLRKAQQRGHILEGLIFAVCDIDEVDPADPQQQDARRGDREADGQRASASPPDHPATLPERSRERC